MPMNDPKEEEAVRSAAYRTANRLLTSAGLALALAGVRPGRPEMEAIRRALRAVNLAGGIGAGGIDKSRKEAIRAFPPGGGRFPRTAG